MLSALTRHIDHVVAIGTGGRGRRRRQPRGPQVVDALHAAARARPDPPDADAHPAVGPGARAPAAHGGLPARGALRHGGHVPARGRPRLHAAADRRRRHHGRLHRQPRHRAAAQGGRPLCRRGLERGARRHLRRRHLPGRAEHHDLPPDRALRRHPHRADLHVLAAVRAGRRVARRARRLGAALARGAREPAPRAAADGDVRADDRGRQLPAQLRPPLDPAPRAQLRPGRGRRATSCWPSTRTA